MAHQIHQAPIRNKIKSILSPCTQTMVPSRLLNEGLKQSYSILLQSSHNDYLCTETEETKAILELCQTVQIRELAHPHPLQQWYGYLYMSSKNKAQALTIT